MKAMNIHNQTHSLILLSFLFSCINTALLDKDENEHAVSVLKNNNDNNTAFKRTSAELVKKNPAPILLNISAHAGMSEVRCKAN